MFDTIDLFSLLAQVAAYDRCWVFGADFASHSFEQHFKFRASTDFNSYTKAHFDVMGYCNNFVICDNPSLISRLGNLLIQAACPSNSNNTKILPLPKIIVVVPDDDIIKTLQDCMKKVSNALSRLVNFVMMEHSRAIASFKEFLPVKSLRNGYPNILWIQAPLHDNFNNNNMRFKFNKCLEDTAKLHANVTTLKLKKSWDEHDNELYLMDSRHFTTRGLISYWESVDHTIRYFDSILLKKQNKERGKTLKTNISSTSRVNTDHDRFAGRTHC